MKYSGFQTCADFDYLTPTLTTGGDADLSDDDVCDCHRVSMPVKGKHPLDGGGHSLTSKHPVGCERGKEETLLL